MGHTIGYLRETIGNYVPTVVESNGRVWAHCGILSMNLQWESLMGAYGAYIGILNMGPTVGDSVWA